MTKYIVPVGSEDGEAGDTFTIEADSADEAVAEARAQLDATSSLEGGGTSHWVVGSPSLA